MGTQGTGTSNCLVLRILRAPVQEDFLFADDRKATNAVSSSTSDTNKCLFEGYRCSTETLANLPNDKWFINMTYLWHVLQST
jgi:hypothetical protein